MSWLCNSNLSEDGNRTKLPRPCPQFEFSLQLRTEVNYVALPINTAQDLSLEHLKGKLIYSRNFMDGDLRQNKSIQSLTKQSNSLEWIFLGAWHLVCTIHIIYKGSKRTLSKFLYLHSTYLMGHSSQHTPLTTAEQASEYKRSLNSSFFPLQLKYLLH